jgi:uncharacterized protein YutE (UPF0331/DUF86 family)
MSTSLKLWQGAAQDVFGELELAHRAVHGRGQPFLTRQIAYAYVTALAAQFQLYCRSVHTETAEALAGSVSNDPLAQVLEARLVSGRWLDRGNPTASNLGSDFGRFDLRLWDVLQTFDRRNQQRRERLDALIGWRNAIVHGDIDRKKEEGRLDPLEITLKVCQNWNTTLSELILTIEKILTAHCVNFGIGKPW